MGRKQKHLNTGLEFCTFIQPKPASSKHSTAPERPASRRAGGPARSPHRPCDAGLWASIARLERSDAAKLPGNHVDRAGAP